MPGIASESDAQFVVDKIRDGTLTGKRKEAAFEGLATWKRGQTKGDSPQAQEAKLNFAERAGEDLERRRAILTDITTATFGGEQSYGEGIFQAVTNVGFGATLDMIGEATVSAGRGIAAITPEQLKGPIKEGAAWAWAEFANSEVGQAGLEAMHAGVEAYHEWSVENPRAARNLSGGVNTALLWAPVKAKPKAQPGVLGKLGDKAAARGAKAAATRKKDLIDDLVLPQQTKKVKTEQAKGRTTEEGLIREKTVELTLRQQDQAVAVAKVPGVKGSNTYQGNLNAIDKAVVREAETLKAALAKADFQVTKAEYNATLRQAVERLNKNMTITGDASTAARTMVAKMDELAAAGKGKTLTGSKLLQARKDFDRWVRTQKRDSVFQPEIENAMSLALSEIRHTTNQFIIRRAKGVGVEASLKQQSLLYATMDTLAVKAAAEGNNRIIRAWTNVMKIMPLRGSATQALGTVFGVGIIGAAAIFAPVMQKVAFGAAGGYLFYKVLTGPGGPRALAAMLKGIDAAIRRTKDANLIKQLRADRAAIIEIAELGKDALPIQASSEAP